MRDNEFKKFQQNILKIINNKTIEKLILNKKVDGSLKDILKSLNKEQFNILKSIYLSDDLDNNLNKQINILEKKIQATFSKILEFNDVNINESLDNIILEEDNIIIDPVLLLGGFIYAYKTSNKIKYIFPNDLIDIYINNIKINEDDLEDNTMQLMLLSFNYGLVPRDLFKNLKPTESYSIKKIKGKEYFWNDEIPYDSSLEEFLDNINYIKRTFDDYNNYMFIVTQLFKEILELLNDVDLDSYYAFAIPLLLARCQESSAQAKIFGFKYNLSSDIETAITTIIDEYQPYIRYWENGGKTIKEVDALKVVLTKIPKDKTLLTCFRSLNEDTINYLLKKYDFKNIGTINELVLDKLKYYLNNNIYDTEFLKNILDHKDKKYDYDNDVTEFLYQNFCFLYKNKLIIPNDVKEMIMDYVYKYPKDETLTDDDYVNLYVLYNGVIERQKLKEMLKDNHNLDYTLKEMDDTIEQVGLKIVGDSYYIPFLQEDLAEAKVIPYKKLLNKYKVLSNDDLKYFTIIDTLSLKIDTLLDKLKIKDYLLKELEASIIILISINEPYIPFLRYFFKSNKIKIKESLFKELLSIIDIYKDDIPVWIYNGYSMREFSKLKQL